MSISVQERAGKYQLRVKHRLLPKPFFHTFDDEGSARAYGTQLHDMLDRGVVPSDLLAQPAKTADDALLPAVVREYLNSALGLTESDDGLLSAVLTLNEIEGLRVSGVTARWAEGYITRLKARRLTPGTIRKRIGALARVLDWHLRRDHKAGEGVAVLNPLRAMPDGYSTYTEAERRAIEGKGEEVPHDEQRDQRLLADAETRVRAALAGEKREGRERAWPIDPAFTLLFDLIIETGLRLSEAYRLRVDQIDHAKRVIRVEGSKGARGARKPRVVPLKPALAAALREWCTDRVGLVFPFWNGTKEDRPGASSRLSQRFKALFDYAKVVDFTEHDLRHEATCRWFELRSAEGAWVFSDIEICRIMGWTDTRLALRYASLRGEDLAARLG